MPEPLIILCPMRSFSSVVCGMLGQHPETYSFPELNLFITDSVKELLLLNTNKGKSKSIHGLVRTLAQLHDGVQTATSVVEARSWLHKRLDWSTKKLFDYIIEQVNPKIGIDKSPVTVMKPEFIERAYAMFPNANFLHLTRHPITTGSSIQEWVEIVAQKLQRDSSKKLDPARLWLYTHSNIINFTKTLPVGQSMQIKGEDILSDPDLYLPQIAEWLGLRTDKEAIALMKHPENSPYACIGPSGARGGNDPKFLENPHLRSGKVSEPPLRGALEWTLNKESSQKILRLAQQMGY